MDEGKSKQSLSDILAKVWAPVAAFIGAIVSIYKLVEIWRGDKEVVTFLIAATGGAVLLVALAYVSFGKSKTQTELYPREWVTRPKYPKLAKPARVALVVVALLMTYGIASFGYQQYERSTALSNRLRSAEGEITILIAPFDGNEDIRPEAWIEKQLTDQIKTLPDLVKVRVEQYPEVIQQAKSKE